MYGGATFDNGNISWNLFWFLYQRIEQARALQRVDSTDSAFLAGALIHASSEHRSPFVRLKQREVDTAYRGK